MYGFFFFGQVLLFQDGDEKQPKLVYEGSYEDAIDISYLATDTTVTETSDDFEANVNNFEQEFLDRINSGGEEEQFRSNQEELMNMITRGWFRMRGIMCEIETLTMDIKMTKTSSIVKIFDSEEFEDKEESIAQRVKKRRRDLAHK